MASKYNNANKYSARPAAKQAPKPAAEPTGLPEPEDQKPLLGNNYLYVVIAGVLIIVGFALMSGAPSGLDAFNPGIFSTRRIVVGPMLSFIGFVLMAVAIIVKPKPLGACRRRRGAQA